jgi:putative DNA primase/helicase
VCLPYDYDPAAKAPTWEKAINRWMVGDPELMDLLQRFAGYILLFDTSQQIAVINVGDGNNGKSVYCFGIEALLGPENVSHLPLEEFGSRFGPYSALGKLANICPEIGEFTKADEAKLKSHISGDTTSYDRKGLPIINAKPTARLLLATNNLPKFTDKSEGTWRRLRIVPWNAKITEQEKVAGMASVEWWQESGELPGMLNLALQGLVKVRSQGFNNPAACAALLETHRQECNTARAFLMENYEAGSQDDKVVCKEIYWAYQQYCHDNGHAYPVANGTFGKEIVKVFNTERKLVRVGKDRDWFYCGIRLKPLPAEGGAAAEKDLKKVSA